MCLSIPHVILVYACVHSRMFASDLSPHSPTLAPHHYGNVTGTAARFLLNLLRRFWSNHGTLSLIWSRLIFSLGEKQEYKRCCCGGSSRLHIPPHFLLNIFYSLCSDRFIGVILGVA